MIPCKRHEGRKLPSPGRAAGFALAGLLVLGLLAGPASAADHRGHDFRGDRRHGGWGGGWHRPPPVVYGSPYYAAPGSPYYPPPVVYGPGIDIALPGIVIH
jgi:hypothetical protein